MSEPRETPETDAQKQSRGSPFACVPYDFARRLERERDAAREASRKWCNDFTALEPELRRMVESAKRIKVERDEAREMLRTVLHEAGERGISDDTWDRARALLDGAGREG